MINDMIHLIIPFLCLFQVGAFLKSPKFPIWIIGSETHLTVFFTKASSLFSSLKEKSIFHTNRHMVCNLRQAPQKVRKTKIWNVVNRFDKLQSRYQCGGKREGRDGGEEKEAQETVIYGQLLFLGFSPIEH